MLRGGGRYTIVLDQVGKEPRTVTVSFFSDPETQKGTAYFHVPYRVSEPGEKLRSRSHPECRSTSCVSRLTATETAPTSRAGCRRPRPWERRPQTEHRPLRRRP